MSMKELEYPFDEGWILSNRRKIRKKLLASDADFMEKRVAVLGGSTTANIVQILDLFLLQHGIKALFYESEYGMYYEDAVFGNNKLAQFCPDVIYICTTNRNVTAFPKLSDTTQEVDSLLEAQMRKFIVVWESASRTFSCPIIQNNFEMPLYRLLGNKDASDIHGAVNFLSRLNAQFYEYAQKNEDFFICDINFISADYGLKKWSDPFFWYMYKYALNVSAIPYLAFNVANIIKSIFGKNKKGFVLDLDNTLWGGVISEDGVDQIKIGPDTSSGQAYLEFQRYIKLHKQLGVILNIASKNEESTAIDGIQHPDNELSVNDFIEIRANWNPKDESVVSIAHSLHLLPESLVFIDDNPAERHIVSEQLPDVSAPEIGEIHQYITNIDRNGFFETTYMSSEDMNRNKMYEATAKRNKLQAAFSNYGEYLDSLGMKATIRAFDSLYTARIVQLTNKSNQFNLTTRRYTQGEIEEISRSAGYITLYGKLEDRFGDNGVVSVCIGRIEDRLCHVELWLMSCRVLKRDMEFAMMDALVQRCREIGVSEIRGYYYPTSKNGMVKDFYAAMGFEMISQSEKQSVWVFHIDDSYTAKNKHIQLEENK